MKKFFYWSLLFWSLFLASCSPQPDKKISTPIEITRADVQKVFINQKIVFNDEIYCTFNPDYLQLWQDKFLEIMYKLGMTNKWSEDFDCDSYAMLKASIGQTLFPVQTFNDNKKAQNVAVGEYWYIIEKTGTGHAINVVIVSENGKLQAKFVDIYTGKWMQLTDKEKTSAFFIRF